MHPNLDELLDYLVANVNLQRQKDINDLHRRALLWEPVERLPLVISYPLPEDVPFKPYPHRQIFESPEKMLYNELLDAWNTHIAYHHLVDDDLPYTIRANFGTGIIASLFGGKVEQIADNPPWVRHFDTVEAFRAAFVRDPLDFSQGWCPRVVETLQFYNEVLSRYPKLQQSIKIVLPDLQGPIDTAEQLRGSAFYTDFYDDPDLVKEVLQKIAIAQVGFAHYLQPYLHEGCHEFTYQHGVMIRGSILIRDDSAIMISPKMYKTHVAPHDEFILQQMGGGGVHSCGRFQHNAREYFALPSVKCIDMGQPQLNDRDALYTSAQTRGTALVRMQVDKEELTSGQVMQRFPTGVSLLCEAESLQDAQQIMAAYKTSTATRS